MILYDYITLNPNDELRSALHRVPSTEYSKVGSLKGRAICVYKTCYHAVALVLKPLCYFTLGLGLYAINSQAQALSKKPVRASFKEVGVSLMQTGMVAPLGQILQLFKAAMGILHPGCYFKENEFTIYFNQLTDIAKEVGCDKELIKLMHNGPYYISLSLQQGISRLHYEAQFKRDLEIICKKMSEPTLSSDEKIAILNMFASLPSDPLKSGIQACPPGLGRLLEQICGCIDIPKNPEKVLPWLEIQLKEESLHQLVMQIEKEKYICALDVDSGKPVKHDPAHFGNFLISLLGKKIGLPQEMIDKSTKDLMAKTVMLPDDEQKELLAKFNKLYTEKALTPFLINRINSQPDGRPGLKDFRNHIIQTLANHVSDDEIAASQKEVQKRFGVGEAVSDEPIFYVKLHYFLDPDAAPSDEKASDLNEKGIRAFAATLDRDPFNYFASKVQVK